MASNASTKNARERQKKMLLISFVSSRYNISFSVLFFNVLNGGLIYLIVFQHFNTMNNLPLNLFLVSIVNQVNLKNLL